VQYFNQISILFSVYDLPGLPVPDMGRAGGQERRAVPGLAEA
jgi:hypothetical protein